MLITVPTECLFSEFLVYYEPFLVMKAKTWILKTVSIIGRYMQRMTTKQDGDCSISQPLGCVLEKSDTIVTRIVRGKRQIPAFLKHRVYKVTFSFWGPILLHSSLSTSNIFRYSRNIINCGKDSGATVRGICSLYTLALGLISSERKEKKKSQPWRHIESQKGKKKEFLENMGMEIKNSVDKLEDKGEWIFQA